MLIDEFISKELINKGWSDDKKYHVIDKNDISYLLRVSAVSKYDEKLAEFNMMKKVESLGVPMCRPVEFGTCEEGVYSVQTWIDGQNAKKLSAILLRQSNITTD